MSSITINREKCIKCGICAQICPVEIFEAGSDKTPRIDEERAKTCFLCGQCVAFCTGNAIIHPGSSLERSYPIDLRLATNTAALIQFLKTRRSIRNYKVDAVPEELISRVIDAARWAPSARNTQSIHWIIIKNPEEVRRLSRLIGESLKRENPDDLFAKALERGKDAIFRGAPHLAVTCAPESLWGPTDCAIALTYFELAAVASGLGTCWAGILIRAQEGDPGLREELKVPEGLKIYGAMMFGYPRYTRQRIPGRKEASITWR